MSKGKIGAFVAVCLCTLLSACATATVGRDFNDKNLAQMEVGRTTIDQATALLGAPPTDSVHTAKGNWAYEWKYVRSQANSFTSNVETGVKDVTLVFSGDGKLIGIVRLAGIELNAGDRARLAAIPPNKATSLPTPVDVSSSPTPEIGQFSNRVEALPEVKACNAHAIAGILGKGPGYENYSVQCTDGNTVLARCEFGNCRVLK